MLTIFCLFALSWAEIQWWILSNLRWWALQALLEQRVQYSAANLGDAWQELGHSARAGVLGSRVAIWPVRYSMSIIYLQTTSGESVGEGRLLDVCAELSWNLPLQLCLGLTLLILPPINQKKKIKNKKTQTKTQQNTFPWTFWNIKKKSHCNGGGSRRSYQHNQKGKEKLLSFTRHCHQQQAQHEEVFSAPGCSYSTGEEQRDINDAVARTSQLD